MSNQKEIKKIIMDTTQKEDSRSNYHKWLIKENSLSNKDSVSKDKIFINAFSGFLSIHNPDFYYNETYLGSCFDDFITCSENLKERVNLLEILIGETSFQDFVRRFDKMYSLPTNYSLKLLIINIDDVVTCSISSYSSKDIHSFELKNIPSFKINSSSSLVKLDRKNFNISYHLRYRRKKESVIEKNLNEDKEIFELYKNIYQDSQKKSTVRSKFSDFNKLFITQSK
jgi:hypothetical protein